MKTLTVSALVCALMVLTRAAVLPDGMPVKDQIAKSHLVKRSVSCPGGWSPFNGRCFRYFPRPLTWAKAEKNCESMGGNLASVHNILEYHEIQRLILSGSHEYKQTWVGGSDAQEEKQWFWTDGTPFRYMNWCDREPNNSRGRQHCLQVNHGAEKCWDDVECYLRKPSVCAKKI
ncbi:ladderlectin-like [Anoplopoma fimbria]|uniref:ladderlectin-like n=1 Tax=Anoplopoma fimbria TaxID=229290 RepID=UPI0023EDE671|nr:ladderlectin-like [Anoplopoma fimbria]